MADIKASPLDSEQFADLLTLIIEKKGSFKFRPQYSDWIYDDSCVCTCSPDPILVLTTIQKWHAKAESR